MTMDSSMKADLAESIRDLAESIREAVQRGFATRSHIKWDHASYLSDYELGPDDAKRLMAEVLDQAVAEHVASASQWGVTDNDRLDAAMLELDSSGIIARQNWVCCPGCGRSAIKREMTVAVEAKRTVRGCVFYHYQTTETAVQGDGVYLQYDAVGRSVADCRKVGKAVVRVLRAHGLAPSWSGAIEETIHVPLVWQRRSPAAYPVVSGVCYRHHARFCLECEELEVWLAAQRERRSAS